MSNRIPCHPALRTVLFILLTFAVIGTAARSATKAHWDPIPPEDLAAKDSKTNPGADAEILLRSRDFSMESGWESSIEQIVRTKIYTAKGVEDRGRLFVEAPPYERVTDLEARVVKPDGKVLLLKKEDFLESTIAKYDNNRWKKIAFAFPDLTPGDVVEFRWTSIIRGYYYTYWDFCQETLPVREYRFKVSKYATDYTVSWFNCDADLKPLDKQAMILTTRNRPAFTAEEFMPPEREFRGWVSIIRNYRSEKENEVWQEISEYRADEFNLMTKAGGWKNKAVELTANAADDNEKLRRIYDFCQSTITNIDWSDTPEAKAAKEKRNDDEDGKRDLSGSGSLNKKLGTAMEVNYAFAVLARAAGFEVKESRSASRAELINIKMPKGWAFLDRSRIAVKTGGKWRIFDPGNLWAPCGMLDWTDEMATMLLCDGDKIIYEDTPVSPAKMSPVERKGRFSLDDEGTLQGEVEETYSGHVGMDLKKNNWDKTQEDTDKKFTEDVVKRLPTAEISEIHWDNLRNREYPVKVRYKVRIPGYAEQAGTRLAFAPEYFEAGRPVIFAAEKRQYPIFFPYARYEHDDVEVQLPDGFQLDHPSAPAKVGDVNSTFGAEYKIEYFAKKKVLHYTRGFVQGGNGVIAFQTQAYPALKQLFDHLHRSDTHSLIIRPVESAATPATPINTVPPAAPKPATP